MILNRPGCDLLEAFVRDLACLLKSYEIELKVGLLDQEEIDSQGGIASYMQRNLDLCDYVLIVFTENSNGRYNVCVRQWNGIDRQVTLFDDNTENIQSTQRRRLWSFFIYLQTIKNQRGCFHEKVW